MNINFELILVLFIGLLYSCSSGSDNMNNHESAKSSKSATTSLAIPDGPCSDPAFTQMDFWVGNWDGRSMVPDTSQESGWKIAKVQNTVNKILDGCVVEENFDGSRLPTGAFNGKSYSTYSKPEGIWHQTWVDNQGGYFPFYGIFEEDKKIFRREFVRNGNKFFTQMAFYNIEEDSFTWDWVRSSDEGKTWKLIWRIEYTRNM